MSQEPHDITGQKFGKLTARWPCGYAGVAKRVYWLCSCDCGQLRVVIKSNLMSGNSRSCRCTGSPKHGRPRRDGRSREYHSWYNMKTRCSNEKYPGWKNYGGRGIAVCVRWKNSFENFLADMGQRPENTTLDRYPNPDGNYEPGNCRWATAKQQQETARRGGQRRASSGNVKLGHGDRTN